MSGQMRISLSALRVNYCEHGLELTIMEDLKENY